MKEKMEQAAAKNERKKSKRRGYVEPPPEAGKGNDATPTANEDPGEGKKRQEMIEL